LPQSNLGFCPEGPVGSVGRPSVRHGRGGIEGELSGGGAVRVGLGGKEGGMMNLARWSR